MKILVPVKQVASLEEDFEIRDDGKDVQPEFRILDINEWDEYALEQAVAIRESSSEAVEVVAVTVGPQEADEVLRKCLAKGADRAVRVWDDAAEGSDPIAIARMLAAVARREAPGMIFAGVQTADNASASTGIALAGLLDWPHVAVVVKLEYTASARDAVVQRELEGGLLHEMEVRCPAILTIQLGINSPRYASLRAIKQAASKPVELLSPAQLGLSTDQIGPSGSSSRVRRIYLPERAQARMVEGSAAEQAAELARVIREYRGGAKA